MYADPWVRGHGLRFGVWLGSPGAAIAAHPLNVGTHRGLVGEPGRCWLALALLCPVRERSLGPGCEL